MLLSIGDTFPLPATGEAFTAMLQGGTFWCAGFMQSLRAQEIRQFRNTPLRYGCYIYEEGELPVPFFLVDIIGTEFYFDISLTFTKEKEEVRDRFLEEEGNLVTLIMCDYPSGKIRALRAFGILPAVMQRIKDACRAQLPSENTEQALQTNTEIVDQLITECYNSLTLEQMIAATEMHRAGRD